MKRIVILPAVIILLLSPGVGGEQIYRSVDGQGRVTYSDEPLPGSVEVQPIELAPAPTETDVAIAKERARRTEALANEMQQKRLQQQAAIRQQQKEQEQAPEYSEGEDRNSGDREYGWGYPVNEYYRRRQAIKRKFLKHAGKPGSGRPGRPPHAQHLPSPSRPATVGPRR